MKLSILTMAILMILIDIGLFLSQTAIVNVAAIESVTAPNYHQYENSVLSKYDSGNFTTPTNISELLPAGQGEVEPTTGGFFTDLFATMKNWVLDVTGLNYVIGIVTAVPTLIGSLGFYPEVSFALSALWHMATLLLLILGLLGKN